MRVETLAADFECIDRWRFHGHVPFDRFLDAFWAEMHAAERSFLAQLRLKIGRLAGWDERPNQLPIPGCSEASLTARLTDADRARSRAGPESPLPAAAVKTIYVFADEALYEVSNDTVHALIHLAPVGDDVELGVYIKSRGPFTRLYMAAIWPFRHFIVYPRLIAAVERRVAA